VIKIFKFFFEKEVPVYSEVQYENHKIHRMSLELFKISTEKSLLSSIPNIRKSWLKLPGKNENIFILAMYYPDATLDFLPIPYDANYFLAISKTDTKSPIKLYSQSNLNYDISDDEFNNLLFIGASMTPPFTFQQLFCLNKICR